MRITALPGGDERAGVGFGREEKQAEMIEPCGGPVLGNTLPFGLVEIERDPCGAVRKQEDAGHRDPRVGLGGAGNKLLALEVREDSPAVGGFDEGIERGQPGDRAVRVDSFART